MPKFTKSKTSKNKSGRVEWVVAADIQAKLNHLISILDLEWLEKRDIHCFRSYSSKSRAFARIWGLSRIWQIALGAKPAYIIEALAEKFDRLTLEEQDKILLHEIAHIPKNFSGSLLPHIRRGKRNFNDKVRSLVAQYKRVKS